jgi:uncharacterized membrane protein
MPSPTLSQKLADARRELATAQDARKAELPLSSVVWMESGIEIAGIVFCLVLCVTPAVIVCLPVLVFFVYAYVRDTRVRESHDFRTKMRDAEIARLNDDIRKLEIEIATEEQIRSKSS